jgi:hypothetical protein
MKIIPALLMGGLLVFFGWMIIRLGEAAVNQHDSESFPQVMGVVVSSEVTTTHGSRGSTYYHVHINYRYSVEGLDYLGHRYRYDGHPNGGALADATVAAHRPGTFVEVYYNPQDPRDTVLSTGVDAGDVAMPFFMAGTGLFLMGVFLPGLQELLLGANPVAGGVKIISEMRVTRVRLPRFEPLKLGLLTVAGLCVAAALLTATGVLQPPWPAAQWSLAGVVLGALAVYAVQSLKIRSGRQDLVIDESGRTVQLPLTYKRRERTPLPFADIRSVGLDKVRHKRRSGAYYTYLVTLKRADNSKEKLVDLKLPRAKAFAAWLREQLGLSISSLEVAPEDET